METRRLWMMWWSGIFAVAAFVHLMRVLANLPITIGTVAIPMWVSWMVCPVAGVVSGWLMRIALEGKPRLPPRPFMMPLGGLHPKSAEKKDPQPAGQTYCGIQAGAADLSDDWPEDEYR